LWRLHLETRGSWLRGQCSLWLRNLKDLTCYGIKALDKLNTFRRIPLLICSLFFTEDFPITDIHLLVSLFGYLPQITAHTPFWFSASLFIDREEIQQVPLSTSTLRSSPIINRIRPFLSSSPTPEVNLDKSKSPNANINLKSTAQQPSGKTTKQASVSRPSTASSPPSSPSP